MSVDERQPPRPGSREPLTPPGGAPEQVRFDGILDGRVADPERLREAVAALNGLRFLGFDCDVDGGRFTLLPDGRPFADPGFDEEGQTRLLEALSAVVATAAPGSVESTLRCRMLYPSQVVETLFRAAGSGIEPLSRIRERTAADGLPAEAEALGGRLGLGRRQLLLLAPLLLLAAALIAWRAGWIERVLAARAENLEIDTGPFGDMLAVEIGRSWGDYVVRIRRGPGYPPTARELQRIQSETDDLAVRAACEAVGSGGLVWLQLHSSEDTWLDAAAANLRPLVVAADGVVEQRLPGRIFAHRLILALSDGKPR